MRQKNKYTLAFLYKSEGEQEKNKIKSEPHWIAERRILLQLIALNPKSSHVESHCGGGGDILASCVSLMYWILIKMRIPSASVVKMHGSHTQTTISRPPRPQFRSDITATHLTESRLQHRLIISSLWFPCWAHKADIDWEAEHREALLKMDYLLNCVWGDEVSWREML